MPRRVTVLLEYFLMAVAVEAFDYQRELPLRGTGGRNTDRYQLLRGIGVYARFGTRDRAAMGTSSDDRLLSLCRRAGRAPGETRVRANHDHARHSHSRLHGRSFSKLRFSSVAWGCCPRVGRRQA